MADSKEAQFQQDIISAMVAQGWLTGPASGYDRRTALYTEDFLGYFKDAWPERWDKFAKANPNNPEAVLVQKLVRELEQDGTLDVLRHGFKLPGVKIVRTPTTIIANGSRAMNAMMKYGRPAMRSSPGVSGVGVGAWC